MEETDYRGKSLGAVSSPRSFLLLLCSVSFPLRQELTPYLHCHAAMRETSETENKINPFSHRLFIFYHDSKNINPLETFLFYVL